MAKSGGAKRIESPKTTGSVGQVGRKGIREGYTVLQKVTPIESPKGPRKKS